MKKVMLIAAAVALMVPAYAGNMLVNGNFEQGLSGWTVVQDLTAYGGSVQTPIQTGSTANPFRIMRGVIGGSGLEFQDAGQLNPSVSLQYGTSCGVSRAGLKGLPGTGADPLEGSWSWISQTFTVAPGEYYVLAEWDTFAWSTGGDYSQGCVLMAFGDDPNDGQPWDVGFYGNDNSVAEPPRTRASHWNHQSSGWLHKSWTMASNKTIKTYSGQVEFRWVFKDKAPAGEITNLAQANYALLDNCSVDLVAKELYPVPEPSSLLAIMSGIVGLGGLAIRRRK